MQRSSSRNDQIRKNKLLLFLLLIFIGLHIPYIFRGLSGVHRWRQADTAAVARNFYQESPDFLKPRVDCRRDKSGITAMEFPIYNYVVSVLYRISGKAWFGFGQLISLLFAIGCLFLMLELLILLNLTLRHKFILPVVLFLTPLYFTYSTCFMPETMSLFMALLGNVYFLRWVVKHRFKWWHLSWLFFSVSILIRPYMIVLYLPILVYSAGKIIERKMEFPIILLEIFILIPFSIWYFWYCPYLNKKFELNYFYFGTTLKEGFSSYLDPRLWTGMLEKLTEDVVGWVLLPFFLFGFYLSLKTTKELNSVQKSFILGIPLITFLGLPLISDKHYLIHAYYLFGTLPSITIITSLGLNKLFEKWRKSWYLLILISIIFIGNNFYTYKKDRDLKNLEKFIPFINEISTRDDLFIVEDNGAPTYLYIINRRGWSVDKKTVYDLYKLKSFYKKGAKFLLRKIAPQEENFEILNLEEVFAKAK